jgi:hypothetical protein
MQLDLRQRLFDIEQIKQLKVRHRLMSMDRAAESPKSLHGLGHHEETYFKTDNRWAIQSLKLTHLHIDRLPGP